MVMETLSNEGLAVWIRIRKVACIDVGEVRLGSLFRLIAVANANYCSR